MKKGKISSYVSFENTVILENNIKGLALERRFVLQDGVYVIVPV